LGGRVPNPEKLGGVYQRTGACHLAGAKCLAEIHARTDAPDVSKIIAEAELTNPAWPDVGFNPTIRDFRIGFRLANREGKIA